jgi:hypothetical protein
MCSVVERRAPVLSYQPRDPRFASSKFSWNSSVPPGGGGGGGAVTVTADEPVLLEHVAVMVAEPAAMPLTAPLEFTVAAAELLVDQVIVCPVMTFPSASLTVAVSVVVAPTANEAVEGATVTVVTTGGGGGTAVTVTVDVPDLPAHVAVIVAEPAATPLTTPLEFTVAADALLVDHVIVCPVMALPWASLTVAVSVTVALTFTDADDGATVTVVTTGGGGGVEVTVTLELPDLPAHVAVIVAVPAATPVTTPLELAVAALALLVDQVTLCPLITLPCASFTVAWSVVVAPTAMEADAGVTVTVVTTGGGGACEGVDADATFDTPPKTASVFRVPRNATTWKL